MLRTAASLGIPTITNECPAVDGMRKFISMTESSTGTINSQELSQSARIIHVTLSPHCSLATAGWGRARSSPNVARQPSPDLHTKLQLVQHTPKSACLGAKRRNACLMSLQRGITMKRLLHLGLALSVIYCRSPPFLRRTIVKRPLFRINFTVFLQRVSLMRCSCSPSTSRTKYRGRKSCIPIRKATLLGNISCPLSIR